MSLFNVSLSTFVLYISSENLIVDVTNGAPVLSKIAPLDASSVLSLVSRVLVVLYIPLRVLFG